MSRWPSLANLVGFTLPQLAQIDLSCVDVPLNTKQTNNFMKFYLHRSAESRKNTPRVDWVNSSSAYKKEEVDVAGAPRVKKVTKVSDFFVFSRYFIKLLLALVDEGNLSCSVKIWQSKSIGLYTTCRTSHYMKDSLFVSLSLSLNCFTKSIRLRGCSPASS